VALDAHRERLLYPLRFWIDELHRDQGGACGLDNFQRQGKLRVALFRLDAGVELDGITDAPSGQGVRSAMANAFASCRLLMSHPCDKNPCDDG
jgi:hypothetical protein